MDKVFDFIFRNFGKIWLAWFGIIVLVWIANIFVVIHFLSKFW